MPVTDAQMWAEISASAFGAQQLTEFVDSIVVIVWKTFDEKNARDVAIKKTIDKAIALIFAVFATTLLKLSIPQVPAGWMAQLVTIFAIAAGTDGVNSLLKAMAYAKETQKAVAAAKRAPLTTAEIAPTDRV